MSAPASIRASVPSAETTLPATTGTRGSSARTARSASSIRSWWPWAVSTTRQSTPASSSSAALAATSPLTPIAAAIRRPPSRVDRRLVERGAQRPVRRQHADQRARRPSTATASGACAAASSALERGPRVGVVGDPARTPGSSPAGPARSGPPRRSRARLTTPTGLAVRRRRRRRGASAWGSATAPPPRSGRGAARSGCRRPGAATSRTPPRRPRPAIGMSCGITASPPRRATVSAIRLPAMAVMLATTSGQGRPGAVGGATGRRRTGWPPPSAAAP